MQPIIGGRQGKPAARPGKEAAVASIGRRLAKTPRQLAEMAHNRLEARDRVSRFLAGSYGLRGSKREPVHVPQVGGAATQSEGLGLLLHDGIAVHRAHEHTPPSPPERTQSLARAYCMGV